MLVAALCGILSNSAAMGCVWPREAACGRMRPRVAACGRVRPRAADVSQSVVQEARVARIYWLLFDRAGVVCRLCSS